MPRGTGNRVDAVPATTAQRLGSLIKSARDIMRKDKGLNGDLDRLPMLTWIMFLKFLDDAERVRETEVQLQGNRFVPAIDPPYRWRDWAAADDGITGDALIAFVTNERTARPDGTEGPGLFPYLRNLQGADGGDRRDVIATVFRGTVNRMINGYLLRDVINKVDEIHFASSDEIHTLGALYETLLREMRDAAGDSGEFYTPRPLVRLMVELTNPMIGETVLDPACGTGGFLVEAYTHMLAAARTVQDRQLLGTGILGGEAKPLPYLLSQMNLMLHGIDNPQISPRNSLDVRLADMGERDRVDVILTNPPFGGEEESGILDNFPPDMRTSETSLLFLQLIMRRLRRSRRPDQGPSRAAVIVPNGTLFAGGVAARVREHLLREFNLRAVIRLPTSVFAPYTNIATNILLFDTDGKTRRVWYYQQPGPKGRQRYTKTGPLTFEELAPCLEWSTNPREDEQAWPVTVEEIARDGWNLDLNRALHGIDAAPINAVQAADLASSHAHLVDSLLSNLTRTALTRPGVTGPPAHCFGDLMVLRKEPLIIDDRQTYKRCRVQLRGRGVVLRDLVPGSRIKTKSQQLCRPGDLLVAEIDAKLGGFGIVPDALDGAIVSSHYFLFSIDTAKLDRRYLAYFLRTRAFQDQVSAKGSTNYASIRPAQVLGYMIPLPSVEQQHALVTYLDELQRQIADVKQAADDLTSATSVLEDVALREVYEISPQPIADGAPEAVRQRDLSKGPSLSESNAVRSTDTTSDAGAGRAWRPAGGEGRAREPN